jgi:anti-sigma regulatory factor (Ser/Thr protein kinase)
VKYTEELKDWSLSTGEQQTPVGPRLSVTSERAGIAQARQATRDYLREHCTWAGEPEVVLVVSELVTNAVRHAGGWWRLTLCADSRRLVVEIEDGGAEMPRFRTPSPDGLGGGLGLIITAKLAAEFEFAPNAAGPGKKVRATWHRGPEDRPS